MASPLKHLPVMIVDCQATGANPDNGHLLEIGWTIIRDATAWKPLPEDVCSLRQCFLQVPPFRLRPDGDARLKIEKSVSM